MKMHKYEIYVIDSENLGPRNFEVELDNIDYFNVRSEYQGTTDIGEWEDSHELNFTTTSISEFRKYFKRILPK